METPRVEKQMRFGNEAFRTFHAKLMEQNTNFVTKLLGGTEREKYHAEIKVYLDEGFGQP